MIILALMGQLFLVVKNIIDWCLIVCKEEDKTPNRTTNPDFMKLICYLIEWFHTHFGC